MPFTPYHFGPTGFLALCFRRWIDVPVFVLANVVIDVEVLFAPIGFKHTHWHFHTFLGGAVLGAAWGLLAFGIKPLRRFFEKVMAFLRIPYKASLVKMAISGVLGVWAHTIIDGVYHYDVQAFWPNTKLLIWRMSRGLFPKMGFDARKDRIEDICLVFFIMAIIPYTVAVISFMRKKKEDRLECKHE